MTPVIASESLTVSSTYVEVLRVEIYHQPWVLIRRLV